MKIWLDDIRPAPEGYIWCKSVGEAESLILDYEWYIEGILDELDFEWLDYIGINDTGVVELIDVDHDLGEYAKIGGDGVKLLDWLEETGRNYPIRIHSQNVVGVENMRRIIERNGWKEIK